MSIQFTREKEKRVRTRLSITTAITRAAENWKPDDEQTSMRYNSAFWRAVFISRFGRKPSGLNDKLWDRLFKEGLKLVPHDSAPEEK